MKKLATIIIIVFMVCNAVFASPGYDPGIKGSETASKGVFVYREVIFLSGEPIILDGTVKVTEDTKGTKTTLVYALTNALQNAKLDRKVVYLNTSTIDDSGKQTAQKSTLDPKFSEKITIGSDTYNLIDYKFDQSGIIDDKAVIKYNVSNWTGTKTYQKTNGNQVVVDISSDVYRYDNYWSMTETALIKNTLTYRYKTGTATDFKEAYGTADYAISNTYLKNLEYIANQPITISFKGGYILKESQENVEKYTYDVPSMTNGIPDGKRKKGSNSYKLTVQPTQQRLFIPAVKDVVSSYWAAEDIKQLTSLDIFSLKDSYFRPLSYISRGEFAKIIVKAANIQDTNAPKKFVEMFQDVPETHPYAAYINTAVKAGIIQGTSSTSYRPDDYLTKVEAATIIVRAMGLENASTESSIRTTFADDAQVPIWAKKTVNIARKMGVITGTPSNELEPQKVLTRAETAAMINRFIKYLQYDIKKEYKEKIINFGL